jgi:hypothetical protein
MDTPSVDDLARMRDETVGNVAFDVTDQQLQQVWRDHPHLVALAREWTWGDTEVRDKLCEQLEALGAQPLTSGQPVTVGLRVDVATYARRRAQSDGRTAAVVVGELPDVVEHTIRQSAKVRAAGGVVVVSLAGHPQELPPFADAAVILRVDVTVTKARWSSTAESQTLSEQVRASVAAELRDVEQNSGVRINVDVVSLTYGVDQGELPG